MIQDLRSRLVLNSRGRLTTEVEVKSGGSWFRASAPSGETIGSKEAPSLDAKQAMDNLMGMKPELLKMREDEMDDFIQKNIHDLGMAGVALSLALFKSTPLEVSEFPYPLGSVAGGLGTQLPEFLITPLKANNIRDAILTNTAAHRELGNRLSKLDQSFMRATNPKGGWVTGLGLDKLLEVVSELSNDFDVQVGLDLRANTLWNKDKEDYVYEKSGESYSPEEHVDFLAELTRNYDLFYVEDPMHEEDWKGFVELTKEVGGDCLVSGDDLFATRANLLNKGIEAGACNSVVVKPNQVGSVGSARVTAKLAKDKDYKVVVSHRSGETANSCLARISLAFKADLIKTGIVHGERTAQLNELIRLWKSQCKMVNK